MPMEHSPLTAGTPENVLNALRDLVTENDRFGGCYPSSPAWGYARTVLENYEARQREVRRVEPMAMALTIAGPLAGWRPEREEIAARLGLTDGWPCDGCGADADEPHRDGCRLNDSGAPEVLR